MKSAPAIKTIWNYMRSLWTWHSGVEIHRINTNWLSFKVIEERIQGRVNRSRQFQNNLANGYMYFLWNKFGKIIGTEVTFLLLFRLTTRWQTCLCHIWVIFNCFKYFKIYLKMQLYNLHIPGIATKIIWFCMNVSHQTLDRRTAPRREKRICHLEMTT